MSPAADTMEKSYACTLYYKTTRLQPNPLPVLTANVVERKRNTALLARHKNSALPEDILQPVWVGQDGRPLTFRTRT